mmetsp:Transcript_33842/g.80955  ORF Transcript_33842/g.80955 Transcript_33842/m.80955 type:complete len:227 (-) Transcript_33842:591-1271(-)
MKWCTPTQTFWSSGARTSCPAVPSKYSQSLLCPNPSFLFVSTMGPAGRRPADATDRSLATRSATRHSALHVWKRLLSSAPERYPAIATSPSSGRTLSGLEPNRLALLYSTTSLGTRRLRHRKTRHSKSCRTHGVAAARHRSQTRVARGAPPGGGRSRKRGSSEKSDLERHSTHPALFHFSWSVHSYMTGPQSSSHATTPHIPQCRIRPTLASFFMHISQTRIEYGL